jgi:hypothetical protein
MDRAAFLQEAVARFESGDDDGFVACFGPEAAVYSEPELGETPIVLSRSELSASLKLAHAHADGAAVELANIEDVGDGVVADLIVLSPVSGSGGAWRMALAIRFSGDAVSEIRAFWQRETAEASLRVSK